MESMMPILVARMEGVDNGTHPSWRSAIKDSKDEVDHEESMEEVDELCSEVKVGMAVVDDGTTKVQARMRWLWKKLTMVLLKALMTGTKGLQATKDFQRATEGMDGVDDDESIFFLPSHSSLRGVNNDNKDEQEDAWKGLMMVLLKILTAAILLSSQASFLPRRPSLCRAIDDSKDEQEDAWKDLMTRLLKIKMAAISLRATTDGYDARCFGGERCITSLALLLRCVKGCCLLKSTFTLNLVVLVLALRCLEFFCSFDQLMSAFGMASSHSNAKSLYRFTKATISSPVGFLTHSKYITYMIVRDSKNSRRRSSWSWPCVLSSHQTYKILGADILQGLPWSHTLALLVLKGGSLALFPSFKRTISFDVDNEILHS
ncbi:uncharacterized protein G2W53_015540 [Senna tora]|uniref:Uncharacterized protein n=1 Tax=Senna tora TaxID=362788 RepID=A0A835CA52_9FABA|nr:uncharacterized protein G2W53_015540 [Senna tora]